VGAVVQLLLPFVLQAALVLLLGHEILHPAVFKVGCSKVGRQCLEVVSNWLSGGGDADHGWLSSSID
jgi:hypothetical protein